MITIEGGTPMPPTALINTYANNSMFYKDIKLVVRFLQNNGITPLPCPTCTKKPIYELSKNFVDNETSFHIPTEKRMNIVKTFLNNLDNELESRGTINLAIDTNAGWNSEKNFSFIDIDDQKYVDYFIEKFSECPVVYGRNGCKIMFFLYKQPKTSSYNILNDKGEHIGEFYSSGTDRLCLVYGKHPVTLENPDKPVYYELNIINNTIPTFGEEFTELFNSCLIKENLTLENITKTTNNTTKYTKPEINYRHNPKARTLTEFVGISLSSVISSPMKSEGNLLVGSPFHSSKSNTCFKADISTDSWYCFQCNSSGGPLEYLAIEWNILKCDECRGNALTGQRYHDMVDELIKHGYMTGKEYRKWMYLKQHPEEVSK